MCDTMIALGNATADGSVLFAKNSDREPNEAYEISIVPGATHPEGSQVQCTYIAVPQVPQTYSALLVRPTWMWGGEMGANEHGVIIGNEALFTRIPEQKKPGLIGMDFLRLALERSRTARQAMDTIIALLEKYGQSGNCGFAHPMYYQNSYLIGDLNEAWVLETVDRQWAAEKVQDIRTISNTLTIGRTWDLASAGLVDYAVERGWCKNRNDFDMARCYSDPFKTYMAAARIRQGCTTNLLRKNMGQLTPALLMNLLRGHNAMGENWKMGNSLIGQTVCMHAGFGPVRINQSVGSLVSRLSPESMTHWLTGTSTPCTGIFKPVWLDAGLPDLGKAPEGTYDPQTLFWRHEVLHRSVILDYETRIQAYAQERDDLESRFIEEEKSLRGCSVEDRRDFTRRCFERSEEATARWIEAVQATPVQKKPAFHFASAWARFNREAKMPSLS